ncbi:hypothetical protein ES703_91318 [subsurface metagenome]
MSFGGYDNESCCFWSIGFYIFFVEYSLGWRLPDIERKL